MSATTLTDADFARAAKELNVEVAAIRAVAEVEAAGRVPARRPTGDPLRGACLSPPDQRRARQRQGPQRRDSCRAGNGTARSTARPAATSTTGSRTRPSSTPRRPTRPAWGTFQIMGENYKAAGCSTIESFVDRMNSGAGAHLDAFVAFIKADPSSTARCATRTGRRSRAATTAPPTR